MTDGKTVLLRHTLATLAYRGGKALRGAPAEFAEFRAGETTRTPAQILAHLGDLLDWALSLAEGKEAWHNSPPLTWEQGTARFFAALEAFDKRLCFRCAARLFRGRTVSGAYRRFPYARWPDCHVAPPGRLSRAGRELL